MALKLPVPLALPQPAALKRTGAKLRAWWNGTDYVEEPQDEAGPSDAAPPVAAVSDPELAARIASEALWGAGRLVPGESALDVAFAGALGMTKGKRLVLFGPDLGARALDSVRELSVKADLYLRDPRDVELATATVTADRKLAKDITVHAFDGAPGSAPKNKADGAVFYLAARSAGEADVAMFTAERVLKPGGSGVFFDLFARRDDDPALDPCRGPEARQFLDEDLVLAGLEASGLELRGQEDRGADLLNAWHSAMERMKADFESFQAGLIQTGGQHAAVSALEQILLWRARADALRAGRLTARRITFQLPK
jgi:hypothetical protein